ncbi:hypothetical protein BH10PSE7_BH10PSE7_16220 [soil metagenome]
MPGSEMTITLSVLAVASALVGTMIYLERRPRTDLNPRLVPTTPILLVSGFAVMLALIHVLNLLGFHTGR